MKQSIKDLQSYFSHDSNARADIKCVKLRKDLGWEGYGLFWAIIELLRDANGYKLETDYETIAFELQVESDVIKQIITGYELFVIEENCFFSSSLVERLEEFDSRKAMREERAKMGAKARWEREVDSNKKTKKNAKAMPKQCLSNAKEMLKQCTSNAKAMLPEMLNDANYTKLNYTKLKDKKDSNNLVEEIKNNTRGGAGGGNPRETVDVEETSSSTLEPFEDFEMKGKRDLKGKNSQKRKQQSTSQSKDPEIAPKENAGEPQMPKTYKHTTESEKLATGENKGQKIDYWKIANEWNEKTKGVMGEIRTLSEKRKTSIRARIRETSEEDFMTMIQLAAQSDFLKGENQRNWTATFDWCIKPTNYEKILSLNFNKQQRKKEEKEKKTDYLEYKSIVDYEQKNGKI